MVAVKGNGPTIMHTQHDEEADPHAAGHSFSTTTKGILGPRE